MVRQTLALLLLASLLVACDSAKTDQAENVAENVAENTSVTESSPAAAAESGDAETIPADWKKVESKDQGVTFAHPTSLKVHTDELKATDKSPMYIAGDEQMVVAVMPIPNTADVTSKSAAEGIFKALVSEFKLTDVEQDAPVEAKDVDGFATWTDIVGSANYEGKPHIIRSSGGKGIDGAKSSVGFFALYPDDKKNDEVYGKIYSSLKTVD